MKIIATDLPDILIVEPRIFADARGFFYESFNQMAWEQATGLTSAFVQDNHSRSIHGVLRGLHYQIACPQGKLVRCVSGEIFDVAVDLRRNSPTLGRWVGAVLSAENRRQMWVPEGYAHGFLTLSATAEVLYKTTDYYAPQHERAILWSDPELAIDWPLSTAPLLSGKDAAAPRFADAELFPG